MEPKKLNEVKISLIMPVTEQIDLMFDRVMCVTIALYDKILHTSLTSSLVHHLKKKCFDQSISTYVD